MSEHSNQQEPRPIHVIAREIISLWVDKDGRTQLRPDGPGYAAQPYVTAMRHLVTINDTYGYDDAKGIIIRFLGNATSWRGEDARRIKAELKKMAGLK